MNIQKEKVVGILGGMGPEATVDLFSEIIHQTKAKNDDEHLRIIIDNNPKIPSRQDAILKGTESPGPSMALTGKNLEAAGADFIILGANTAHHFYSYVKEAVNIPVLHIIGETVLATIKSVGNVKKVGVLAAKGAMKTGMYQNAYQEHGIATVDAPERILDLVHDAIFSFKYEGINEKNVGMMKEAITFLIEQGAEAIVMGCTEIPLILKDQQINAPLINPNTIIASVAVAYAKNKIEVKEVGGKYLSVVHKS